MPVTSGRPASPLRASPLFRRYWLARTISMAGTAASGTVLPLLVYDLTRSPLLTAATDAVTVVPYLAFGLIAGVWADRYPGRRLLLGADAVCAVCLGAITAGALWLGVTAAVAIVLVAGFAAGAAIVWFDAASFGVLLGAAGRAGLARANSLIWTTYAVVGAAVPPLAGLLAQVAGKASVTLLDSLSYLASLSLIGLVPRSPAASRPAGARGSAGGQIREGLSYLWRRRVVRTMTLCAAANGLTGGALAGVLVVYADRALRRGSGGWVGLLYAAGGLGAVLGSVLLTRSERLSALRNRVVAALGGACLAAICLGQARSYLLAWPLYLLWYGLQLSVTINTVTVRQRLVPGSLQGRVNTAARLVAYGSAPIGALLGGALAGRLPVGTAIDLMATLTGAGFVIAAASLLPHPAAGRRGRAAGGRG